MELTKANASTSADGSQSPARTERVTGTPTLGYDAFIKLLIAQVQNQDPLEPMASSDYVAQLATFSQVEKSTQTNERIAELLANSRFQQAESLLGRTVTAADGVVSGPVSAVRVADAKVIATLARGEEVVITDGVTIF